MSFALEKVKLWRHIKRTAISTPTFIPKVDDSKEQMERIYAWNKKICEFQDNTCKAIAKIRKICNKTV